MNPIAAMNRPCRHRPRIVVQLILSGVFTIGFGVVRAEDAEVPRVAAQTLRIEPVAGQRKIRVDFRLSTPSTIEKVEGWIGTTPGESFLPVEWTPFESETPSNCAWLILVDNSNPARGQTVEACAAEVREFLDLMPAGDSVMIASLARDLAILAPFGSDRATLEAALDALRAEGDASLTSLIFQNLKESIIAHLADRNESRRCVVLFTDGKDETPGGPLRISERRDEAIEEANRHGIVLHTLGFAEKATEANFFADLKELSIRTAGRHVPASVATRRLPGETWSALVRSMHGGGTAVLDLSEVAEPGPVRLKLIAGEGGTAIIAIPDESVRQALKQAGPPVPDPVPAKPIVNQAEVARKPVPGWIIGAIGGVLGWILLVGLLKRRKRPESRALGDANPLLSEEASPIVSGDKPVEKPLPTVAFLAFIGEESRRHPVTRKGVTIGRGPHNDLVIDHDSVSNDHCTLSYREDEWVVSDVGSANGTQVNGGHYHSAGLSPGNVIQVGEVRLRFVLAEEG